MMFFKYLLFILALKCASACIHKTFHNTSVTLSGVRRPINTIDGCFGPGKNIDTVSLIQILNESVPVLHEDAFNNLDSLLDIILENDKIQEIRPGAFRNLPKIYLIRLKNNDVREIREGVFNNLSLSELSLVGNNIETIQSGAFDNLLNLTIILLSDNKLRHWDPNWFKNSPKINVLNFENNLITTLPSKSFQNIQGVHVVNKLNVSTSIHLNSNKIRVIEDGAFDGLKTLGWLFLHRNEIDAFSTNSLGNLEQVDWLRLDHNHLECIPEKLAEIAPNVKYYLDGNPLSEDCIAKYNIKRKNGARITKFNISIN